MRALSSRLTLFVGGIVLLAVLAVSLAGYASARIVIERQIHDRVEASSAATMATVDAYLAARAEELRTMANGNLTIHSLTPQDRTRILFDYASAFGNNRYSELAIVDAKGAVLASSTGSPDFASHPDVLKAFNAAVKPGIADLRTFADLSTPVFVVYTPITSDTGARAGTLVGRLQTAELSDLVRTVPVDEHTAIYLVHRGTALAEHRGTAAPTIARAGGEMKAQADGKSAADLGLATMVAVDRGAALAPVTQLALQSAIVGLIALVLAGLVIVAMARSIARPLNAVAGAAQRLAGGRLDARVEVSRADVRETIELADAFNSMSETLRALLGGVEHASRTVSVAVRENVVVANSVREGAEEQSASLGRITSALSEVAANARAIGADSDQLETSARGGLSRLDELVREVEGTEVALHQLRSAIDLSNEAGVQLATQSTAVAERAGEVGRRADTAKSSADVGSEHVRRLVADIRDVGGQLGVTVERLEHLADATAGAIQLQLDVINDIAERSKLLALNAGIEAARAGEHGRGFGVIAQELHRLASGSKSASDEVGALVGSVVAETTQLVGGARAAADVASAAVSRAAETGEAIDRLVAEIGENATGAREIGAIAAEQAARTAELETATAEMRRMAETTSRSAMRVAALSRDVRVAVDLATAVAAQVAGAVREQTKAFDVMERGAVEIQGTTQRVADYARRSFDATDELQREIEALVGTVHGFSHDAANGGHGDGDGDGPDARTTAAPEIASTLRVPSLRELTTSV